MKKIINQISGKIKNMGIILFPISILVIAIMVSFIMVNITDNTSVIVSGKIHRESFICHPTTKENLKLNFLVVVDFISDNDSVTYYKSVINYKLCDIASKLYTKDIGLLEKKLFNNMVKTKKFSFISITPNDEVTEGVIYSNHQKKINLKK